MHAQKSQGWSHCVEKPHKATPPCTVWGTGRAIYPKRRRSVGDRDSHALPMDTQIPLWRVPEVAEHAQGL